MIYLILYVVLLYMHTAIDAWMDGLVFYKHVSNSSLWHTLKPLRILFLFSSGFCFGKYLAVCRESLWSLIFQVVVVLLIRWWIFEVTLEYLKRKWHKGNTNELSH